MAKTDAIDVEGLANYGWERYGKLAVSQASPEQRVELAALAPHPTEGGKTNGYRRTQGCRSQIRRLLFMAAGRYDKKTCAFYERLIADG
jgi:hypothetical protein